MIHVPANSAPGAACCDGPTPAEILELLVAAGLGDEGIARVLDVDPWLVTLLRPYVTASGSAGAGKLDPVA